MTVQRDVIVFKVCEMSVFTVCFFYLLVVYYDNYNCYYYCYFGGLLISLFCKYCTVASGSLSLPVPHL